MRDKKLKFTGYPKITLLKKLLFNLGDLGPIFWYTAKEAKFRNVYTQLYFYEYSYTINTLNISTTFFNKYENERDKKLVIEGKQSMLFSATHDELMSLINVILNICFLWILSN